MASEYTFYTAPKSVEDLMVECATLQVRLRALEVQALMEDAASQNPRLASDIADLKKKIEAATKALAIANKLKGEKGAAHRKNIMSKQAAMAKRMTMLRSHSDGIDSGSHVGVGEKAKKKDDAAAKKKESADRRKKNAADQRARSKKLSDERKAAKAAAKAEKAAAKKK